MDITVLPPLPVNVGYHSPNPMYEGQSSVADSCKYLGGKPCYYEGSGLAAEDYFDTLVRYGGDAVWELLENRYHELFN